MPYPNWILTDWRTQLRDELDFSVPPDYEYRRIGREAFKGAHACFERLAQQYVYECKKNEKGAALSTKADRLAFACIYLCENADIASMPSASRIVEVCRKTVAQTSPIVQFDARPWSLCAERISKDGGRDWTEQLVDELTYYDSSIRGYLQELAWFVRRSIDPDQATPKLLQNVADKLGGINDAVGLCRELYDSDDEFYEAIASHDDFGTFQEQFNDRIDEVRKVGSLQYTLPFLQLEIEIHEMIHGIALELPILDRE